MGKFLTKKQSFSLISLLILLLILPFLVILVQKTIQYLSRAQGNLADIKIDTQEILGSMPRPWQALGQGGEEQGRMLQPVISQLSELSPKYIRIDHIFNRYNLVSRQKDGNLAFDFSDLDQTVDDILNCGALPFFSLSYIPETLSIDGSITSPPKNWPEWSLAVQKVIEHYSGKNQRNLSDIYYEVFNEPDLFGNWKISGEPSYLTLYYHAVSGAQKAENVSRFFIGGPGVTAPYPNWIRGFLKHADDNNLRIDFLSWHRYSTTPLLFSEDADNVDLILSSFPKFSNLPKIITEFGFDSENNPAHDTNLSAAHLITVIREILEKIDLAFTFEARDGYDPQGKEHWGRWGVLTYSGTKKPRFFALSLLNKMGRHRIKVRGEGTWVKVLASKELNKIRALLVNFDLQNNHNETVPITFLNLESGIYRLNQESLSGEILTTNEVVTQGILKKQLYLAPNEIIFLELEKIL